jgi:hypothetical protein
LVVTWRRDKAQKVLISLPFEFVDLYHPILNLARNSYASTTCFVEPLGEILLLRILIEAKILFSVSNSSSNKESCFGRISGWNCSFPIIEIILKITRSALIGISAADGLRK